MTTPAREIELKFLLAREDMPAVLAALPSGARVVIFKPPITVRDLAEKVSGEAAADENPPF